MSDIEENDERIIEIESLQSIFPELIQSSRYSGRMEIVVELEDKHKLKVPTDNKAPDDFKEVLLEFLPSIRFEFDLPEGYPEQVQPNIKVAADWLPLDVVKQISQEAIDIWNELKDCSLYSMIDYIKLPQTITSLVDLNSLDPRILDSANDAGHRQNFNKNSYFCSFCQYTKKGIHCVELPSCHHVCCKSCLVNYLTTQITEGNVTSVNCIDCREKLPMPFLTNLVGPVLAARYTSILLKKTDPLAIQCPRDSCQQIFKLLRPQEQLCVCPFCQFAFCRTCLKSWHGKFTMCLLKSLDPEDLEEYLENPDVKNRMDLTYGRAYMSSQIRDFLAEKSFKEYMESTGVQRCPSCIAPIERTEGCNKMSCVECGCRFCFLCGEDLSCYGNKGYEHYEIFESSCYRKLFSNTEIDRAAMT